jgi:4-hydroxy-3-polyprenylbenzoate decarboxylase
VTIEDTHDFISELEKHGELKRIKIQVDSNLEIAEIMRRQMYANGPALLFENVKDYDMPILANAFGSMKRLEIGLEMTNSRYDKNGYTIRLSK